MGLLRKTKGISSIRYKGTWVKYVLTNNGFVCMFRIDSEWLALGWLWRKPAATQLLEIKPQLAIPRLHSVYCLGDLFLFFPLSLVWIPPLTFLILSTYMLNAGGLWPCFGLGGNVTFQLLVLLPHAKATIKSISKWPTIQTLSLASRLNIPRSQFDIV